MSQADIIFRQMCRDILDNGFSSECHDVRPRWEDGTPAHTIKKFCVVNRTICPWSPILTLRPTNLKAAVDEILWIWQKKSNRIEELNSRIWDAWADSEGTIGKAYGYQLQVKHKYIEGEFDQVDRILYDLNENHYSRKMITNLYNHADLHEMALYPCAYSMTFNVTGNRLNAILNQRPRMFLVANNWNVVQYSVLVHMLAHSGLVPAKLVMSSQMPISMTGIFRWWRS